MELIEFDYNELEYITEVSWNDIWCDLALSE